MNRVRTHWKRWLIGGVALAALLVVGGPYVYINYIQEKAPDALSLDNSTTPSSSSSTSAASSREGVDGAWKVDAGSQAGYRVEEVLFGQDTTAVGRTDKVTGTLTIDATKATTGSFTVDLASVTSDSEQRDGQFRGRIMNTAQYPSATFELTEPIDFKTVPSAGEKITAGATGTLTLHGATQQVTFPLTAERTGAGFRVNGSIPVTFADYGIDNPGFAGITVEDSGTIEFLLAFTTS